ncbi:hypothetical protein UA32_11785 [Photobacterium angustum]|nr:hypothetical protein [Photobacterium angustum]KJG37642.1 hypothetical protein UA32_11785 [Photobacterium angustum]
MIEAEIDPKNIFFHDLNLINVINYYQGECCKPCFVMNLSELQIVKLFDLIISMIDKTSNRNLVWLLSDGTPQLHVMPYALIAAKYGDGKLRKRASTMFVRKLSHPSYDKAAVSMIAQAKHYLVSARQIAENAEND